MALLLATKELNRVLVPRLNKPPPESATLAMKTELVTNMTACGPLYKPPPVAAAALLLTTL